MQFIAEYIRGKQGGKIITDDYDKEEIQKNRHIKDLVRDMKISGITDPVRLYDENGHFIRVVTSDSYTPLECM